MIVAALVVVLLALLGLFVALELRGVQRGYPSSSTPPARLPKVDGGPGPGSRP